MSTARITITLTDGSSTTTTFSSGTGAVNIPEGFHLGNLTPNVEKTIYALLLTKLATPGLSTKISEFIKSEMTALRFQQLNYDANYEATLNELCKPGAAEIEDILMNILKGFRESKQKQKEEPMKEALTLIQSPNVAQVKIEESDNGETRTRILKKK